MNVLINELTNPTTYTNNTSGNAAECANNCSSNRDTEKLHQRYYANEKAIHAALCERMSVRRIDMSVRELCNVAGISTPTFYAHHSGSNMARDKYESSLVNGLFCIIPEKAERGVVFRLLPLYVLKNHQYFVAAVKGSDHYLLKEILNHYRPNLVGKDVNDRTFRAYAGSLQIVINCWLEFDQLNVATAMQCTRDLMKVRVMKL